MTNANAIGTYTALILTLVMDGGIVIAGTFSSAEMPMAKLSEHCKHPGHADQHITLKTHLSISLKLYLI